MKLIRSCGIIVGAFVMFSIVGATEGIEQARSFSGEVVHVRQAAGVEGGMRFDEVTLRTGSGEMLRLRLGEAGTCPGCVVEGDRIRVRTMAGDASGEMLRVRKMKVTRTGETFRMRDKSGELITTQARQRTGEGGEAGAGDRLRTRDRTPGSGTCTGTGTGGSRTGSSRGGRRR